MFLYISLYVVPDGSGSGKSSYPLKVKFHYENVSTAVKKCVKLKIVN